MIKPVEKWLYKRIEWNLHHVPSLEAAAVESLKRNQLYKSSLSAEGGVGGRTNRKSDPTASIAMDNLYCEPWLWVCAIKATYGYYGEETPIGQMARMFYGKRATMTAIAKAMGCTRQTAQNYRDAFVTRCAIYAAAQGLLQGFTMEE